MPKVFSNTFTDWIKEECGEVRLLPLDSMGSNYQSTYTFRFNYLKDRGWLFKDRMWVSPDPPYHLFSKVEGAYNYQKLQDEVVNK